MATRVDTGALCSLSQVKDYLALENTKPALDSLLIDFINRASVNIESYCNMVFKSTEYSEFYSGSDDKRIYLDYVPIITVTQVSIGDTVLTDYSVNIKEGYIYRSGGFGTGVNNVYVVYTAGHNLVPKDVVGACVETVAFMSKQSDPQGILGLTSKPVGDMGAVSFIDKLPGGFLSQVKAVLDRHRDWNA